jgi:Rod binding domain-containing protein
MSAMPGLSMPMTDLTAQSQTAASTAELAKRGKIKTTAQAFESSFLSIMLSQMFEGVDTEAPFGGGDGEKMFKSFFTDAIAKQVTKSGGIGLASSVSREMLKLQGLK